MLGWKLSEEPLPSACCPFENLPASERKLERQSQFPPTSLLSDLYHQMRCTKVCSLLTKTYWQDLRPAANEKTPALSLEVYVLLTREFEANTTWSGSHSGVRLTCGQFFLYNSPLNYVIPSYLSKLGFLFRTGLARCALQSCGTE